MGKVKKLFLAAAAAVLLMAFAGCEPNYTDILKDKVTCEVGGELPTVSDYFSGDTERLKDAVVIYYDSNDEQQSPDIVCQNVGTYSVIIKSGRQEYESKLIVEDTLKPIVWVKEVTIKHYENVDSETYTEKYDPGQFIDKYSDNSGSTKFDIKYGSDYTAPEEPGTYSFTIEVSDEAGNSRNCTVTLVILGVEEEVAATEKYGTVFTEEKLVTYRVDEFGNRTEESRELKNTSVDYSGFNGTVDSMLEEAQTVQNEISASQNAILEFTNNCRSEAGAEPLTMDNDLSVMATLRAMELAYSDTFSHTRPDGIQWSTLKDDYGVVVLEKTKFGENLASGFNTDSEACEGWKDSEDHYANMTDVSYTRIGVGKYTLEGKTYWVQWFSSAEFDVK